MLEKNRVVVTGIGVISPNARSKNEFYEALNRGRSGIKFHQTLKDHGFSCQVGGIPENLEELKNLYLTEEQQTTMNSGMVYGALAGIEAWIDAGFTPPSTTTQDNTVHWDTGAIVGTGVGGVDTLGEWVIPNVNEGKVRRLGSSCVERTMSSAISARLGGILGLGGQVTSNSSACTTGTEAVVDAFYSIQSGRATRVLAGGAEGSSHYVWAGFDAMRVLSREFNETPEKASRPMSKTAAGFVPSAGAGILVLESLKSAEDRGARIYAEVLGGHVNSGGQRNGGSMTAPSQEGVIRCIRSAITQARIQPEQIDLINGHLTATMADAMEIENWRLALELSVERFPFIQATKSMIGHGLGAAGGMECVAAILQLDRGFIHGSINCEDIREDLLNFRGKIPETSLKVGPTIIAKSSFGFGDVNGCVIFKKWNS